MNSRAKMIVARTREFITNPSHPMNRPNNRNGRIFRTNEGLKRINMGLKITGGCSERFELEVGSLLDSSMFHWYGNKRASEEKSLASLEKATIFLEITSCQTFPFFHSLKACTNFSLLKHSFRPVPRSFNKISIVRVALICK